MHRKLVVFALFAAACGTTEEYEAFEEDEEEARISYDYRCTQLDDENIVWTLSLRGSAMTATSDAGLAHTGKYDSSYRPRSAANANKVRYKFVHFAVDGGRSTLDEILLDRAMRSGGYTLRTGGRGGFAKLRHKMDTFHEYNFLCRKTTATGGGTSGGGTSGGSRTVEGVRFTTDEASATVRAANGATPTQFRSVGLTTRVINNLNDGRAFDTVESIAGTPYVGKVALGALKRLGVEQFARATPPTGSGLTAQQQRAIAFAREYVTRVTDLHDFEGTDPDSEPPGLDRIDRMGGFETGARIHRVSEDEFDGLFLVIGFMDRQAFVDVFFDNTWLDHGWAEDGDAMQWGATQDSMSDSDPSMCRCEGADMMTCHPVRGASFPSSSMMCD